MFFTQQLTQYKLLGNTTRQNVPDWLILPIMNYPEVSVTCRSIILLRRVKPSICRTLVHIKKSVGPLFLLKKDYDLVFGYALVLLTIVYPRNVINLANRKKQLLHSLINLYVFAHRVAVGAAKILSEKGTKFHLNFASYRVA